MTARELRRERLEHAAERLGELEQALDETRQALAVQLAENSTLVQQVSDLQGLLSAKQAQTAQRRVLLDAIEQATSTLKGMP